MSKREKQNDEFQKQKRKAAEMSTKKKCVGISNKRRMPRQETTIKI